MIYSKGYRGRAANEGEGIHDRRCLSNDDHGGHVHVDLDTLATALYVRIDDELKASPQLNRRRPTVGIAPKITDAELITVAVMQALLRYHDESRWIRYARKALIHLFPYLPKQPGYNKRLRTPGTQMTHLIAVLAADTDLWRHPIRIADSTPMPCGMSRETVQRSDLAGWAGYGYCASHSRLFWGLRLHLVCTRPACRSRGALATPKVDERQVLAAVLDHDPDLVTDRPGVLIVPDKGYVSAELDRWLTERACAYYGRRIATAPHVRTSTYSSRSGSSSSR